MRISEIEQRIQTKLSELEDLRKLIPEDLVQVREQMRVTISDFREVCCRLRRFVVKEQ